MARMWLTLFAVVLLIMPVPLEAHNTSFLPGDAFFHTILTEEVLDSILEQRDPEFGYRRPKAEEYLCGYAGYEVLKIVGMSREFKKQLRQAYYDIRKTTPKQISLLDDQKKVWLERNGLHLLFYNKDFDFEKFQPFVKYNEDWIKETASFGHAPKHVHLERFVPDWDGSEWRDSRAVAALKGEIRKNTKDDNFPEEFVEIRAPVCAVVFTPEDLSKYKRGKDGARFYRVTETEIVVYELEYGSWKKSDPAEEKPRTLNRDPFGPPENEKDVQNPQ